MRRSTEVSVGIAVILGIVLVIFGTLWLQGKRLGSEDMEYRARFIEVGQLLEGSTVKARGVPIGRVQKIELEPNGTGVIITMSIRSDVRLPGDAAVVLSPESMFGDWQAEIVSADRFPTYEFATAREPGVMPGYALPDMSRLTAVADEIAQNMKTLSTSLEQAFDAETADNVRKAIENIQQVSEQLNDFVGLQEQALKEVAGSLENTSNSAGVAAQSLQRALAEVEGAIGGGRLTTIMGNVERTSGRADTLSVTLVSAARDLQNVAARADTSLQRFNRLAGRIEDGQGTLGLLVQDSALYYRLTESSVQLQALLRDVRENPRKYINLTVF